MATSTCFELLSAARHGRLFLAVIVLVLWMLSLSLMIPHITVIATDYFASKTSGQHLHCAEFDAGQLPAECKAANSTTVTWVSGSSFASHVLFGLTCVPLTGWLSDQYGRRPFLLIAQLLAAIPLAWVALYLDHRSTLPFTPYYIFSAFNGAIQPPAIFLSLTADLVPPKHRAPIFSLLLAGLSLGAVVGAGVGAIVGARTACTAALVILACDFALTAGAMPESLPDAQREAAISAAQSRAAAGQQDTHLRRAVTALESSVRASLEVVLRSTLFTKLAVIMALSGMVFECLRDVLFNFFMLTLGFAETEFAAIMIIVGLGGLLVQAVVLPFMLRVTSEKVALVVALVASTFEMSAFALAPLMGGVAAFGGLAVGALGSMAFPIISALKSVNASQDEQGKVQGALFAARALAEGLGPLAFSCVFRFFTQSEHYFPSAPIVLAAGAMAAAAVLATTLKVPCAADKARGRLGRARGDGSLLADAWPSDSYDDLASVAEDPDETELLVAVEMNAERRLSHDPSRSSGDARVTLELQSHAAAPTVKGKPGRSGRLVSGVLDS